MSTNYIIGIVIVLVILGGGFFLLQDGTDTTTDTENVSEEVSEAKDGDTLSEDAGRSDDADTMKDDAMKAGVDATVDAEADVSGSVSSGTTITYTDSGFSPSSVTVGQGETVTFVNNSSRNFWPASAVHPTHSVYDGTSLSSHCPDSSGDAFDACEGLAPGTSWSFTFDKAGSWKYHDHLRASEAGTVVVE